MQSTCALPQPRPARQPPGSPCRCKRTSSTSCPRCGERIARPDQGRPGACAAAACPGPRA
eukprot:15433670-Alexandrium_andersonii.AAC.1